MRATPRARVSARSTSGEEDAATEERAHERRPLGQLLLEAELITPEQLAHSLDHQQRTPGKRRRLGTLLVELGFAKERVVAQMLARQLGIPFVDLASLTPEPQAIDAVPRSVAIQHRLMPLRSTDRYIEIAMADPSNVIAVDDVRAASGYTDIRLLVATASEIEAACSVFYSDEGGAARILTRLGDTEEFAAAHMREQSSVEQTEVAELTRSAHSGPVVQLVNALLTDAVRAQATDIHIEPQRTHVHIRYRVDGLLREEMTIPKHLQSLVISRLKIISGMDIAERRRPQDGRGKVRVDDREIDTRVSVVPTFSGEKVVIRLLPKADDTVSLSAVGATDEQLTMLHSALAASRGLIVFTGPTGAGKTSTMYSALSYSKSPEKNVITLEDPIEYQIPGLNQVQIDEKSGITFSRGLRALLRQDPDVIMVGEVRDTDTAQIVIQSSLTGHLVLTSLHTNDAPSAVGRLLDLGVEPYLLASALSLVIAQRLVRVVCSNCAQPDEDPSAPALVGGGEMTLRRGAGCDKCGRTGYRGRTGIFEFLPVDDEMRERIAAQASPASLMDGIHFESLRDNGMRKVRAGITTTDEVFRVTDNAQQVTRRCPNCDHAVERSFMSCPYCATFLAEVSCTTCGRTLKPEWKLCPYCPPTANGQSARDANLVSLPLADNKLEHHRKEGQ